MRLRSRTTQQFSFSFGSFFPKVPYSAPVCVARQSAHNFHQERNSSTLDICAHFDIALNINLILLHPSSRILIRAFPAPSALANFSDWVSQFGTFSPISTCFQELQGTSWKHSAGKTCLVTQRMAEYADTDSKSLIGIRRLSDYFRSNAAFCQHRSTSRSIHLRYEPARSTRKPRLL